jgi:integrase/recombinase XerD
MTALGEAVEEYLTIRRAVGFKLERDGRVLPQFVDFLESNGATTITIDLALEWAMQPAAATPATRANRLSIVRCFARHLAAFDPSTEVPPTDLLADLGSGRRAEPYPYSQADVDALMAAARQLPNLLTSAGYETLIGLLAVTGMRVGEAIGLDRDDLDWARGVLTVRHAKFGNYAEDAVMPSRPGLALLATGSGRASSA